MTNRFNSSTPGWSWLSNFHPAPVSGSDGRVWPTVEHAYQALKTDDVTKQEEVRACKTAAQAKQLGKFLDLRPGWEAGKLDLMRRLTRAKYTQHPALRAKLLATGDQELVHDCPWGDRYWGVCRGEGQNWQGKILMEIRDELRG